MSKKKLAEELKKRLDNDETYRRAIDQMGLPGKGFDSTIRNIFSQIFASLDTLNNVVTTLQKSEREKLLKDVVLNATIQNVSGSSSGTT